jgi:hypothetical protein
MLPPQLVAVDVYELRIIAPGRQNQSGGWTQGVVERAFGPPALLGLEPDLRLQYGGSL